MCEPRTKEQLVALLNVGDLAFHGAAALAQSRLGAEFCCEGDYVCEVRVFEKGVGRIVAAITGAV